MYMRIVRAQPPEGQADEIAQKWEAFWPEKMRAQPGFRQSHFGINRATGATAAVTVWDDKPDDALVERLMSEFRATLGMSGAQAPEATLYEVVVEV
jgi:heme-degrading monooxygenase HmoA